MSGQPALTLPLGTRLSDDASERLAALFDAHEDRLYRLARRLAGSAAEANDLVQETFLRAAQRLKSVPHGASREEAWLVRVLVNIRRDQWRKAGVRKRSAPFVDAAPTESSSRMESALMTKRAVWAALDALPPRRRAIVVMHELEGMALPAIASFLGMTHVTVRWHLSMARRDLKRILTPFVEEST